MNSAFLSELPNVLDAAEKRYGSLSKPNFSFAERELRSKKYDQLLQSLADGGFTISEDTDLNDDVCRSLMLTRSGLTVVLQLSLVVPVAIVLYDGGRVAGGTDPIVDELQALATLAVDGSLTFIDRESADISVDFDGEVVALYRVLFSDAPLPSEATGVNRR